MAVTTGQVNQLYMELLGRPGAEQYLSDWADSGMTIDQIRTAIANSPEGVSYAESQTNLGFPTPPLPPPPTTIVDDFGPSSQQGRLSQEAGLAGMDPASDQIIGPTAAMSTTGTNDQPDPPANIFGAETVGSNDPILGTIEVLFERHFGRPPTQAEAQSFVNQYNQSGDIDAVDAAIVQAAQTNFGATEASDGIQAGAELEAMRPVVQGLYQELFGRQAGQQGMDYWLSQLRSGAVTPDKLRETLIASAQGSDKEYYDKYGHSQQGTTTPPPEEPPPEEVGDPPVEVVEDDGDSGPIPDPGEEEGEDVVEEPGETVSGEPFYEDTPIDGGPTTTTTDPATTATVPATTTTDPATTTTTGTGTTPGVDQYQGLFDLLDQRYPNLGGKGGTQQPPAPIISEPEPNPYNQGGGDFYSGGGYYRNPYSSGFGMGYQNPYASQRYMPRQGLLGPSGFGGGKGGMSPYGSPYGSSYGSPYESLNDIYGSSFGSPYGSSFGSPYGSPYGSPGKGGGFSRPPTPAKGGGFGQPQLPPRDTTGLTPMGGGNGLADGINDGTIAMQPGDDIFGGNRISVSDHSYTIGDMAFPILPGESVPDNIMQQYLIQQERDRLPPQTQGGQQGRLSQEAVLAGMDPASDQIMGFPTPPLPPPPTTIVDDFGPYSQFPTPPPPPPPTTQAQVGPVRPRPMMAQPAGMRYRPPMAYGGKGGYGGYSPYGGGYNPYAMGGFPYGVPASMPSEGYTKSVPDIYREMGQLP